MVTGGARAVERCDALGVAPYSDTADGLFRAWLTPALAHTHATVGEWMAGAGMRVRRDPATNLVGRYEGLTPDAPALIIGSHLDSVRDAGRYDGPLGVMLGIECVAALHAAGRRMPFAVEVYGFGDEEGSRFPAPMLTSRAVAATVDMAALDVADGEGVGIVEALRRFDTAAPIDPARFREAARARSSVVAYLEAHIEQGPVLEADGLPVGIVTAIAAQVRFVVTVTGAAGHAGTTTMTLRRDALAASAEMVLAVERIAGAGDDVVGTVGVMDVAPGASNVIPGRVAFTLDVRSGEGGLRDTAAARMEEAFAAIAARRDLKVAMERVHDLPASPCDPSLVDMMAAAVQDQGVAPRRLVSGAGHDAMVMAALCPTAMLFVRCAGGISHNPAEAVATADVEVALAAMLGFIDRLGESFDAVA